MSETSDPQANNLLDSLAGVLQELETLEQSYKTEKARLAGEVAAAVGSLARIADSQAVRAQVIRDLYWYKRLSAELIARAFGVKQGAVRTLAGALVLELPCTTLTCPNKASRTFTSKSDLESFERELSKNGRKSFGYCQLCRQQQKQEEVAREAERDAERRREAAERRRRSEELRALPWRRFIETEEWMETRNEAIDRAGYRCELCAAADFSIYVFPHKGTPQDSPSNRRGLFTDEEVFLYHVLCADCVPRCSGLVDEGRYELVKREFFKHIEEWARDQGPWY